MMMPAILHAVRRRYYERRLIEIDGSNLLQWYGTSASTRALEYDAQGPASLSEGRREGHWRRVAKCIARRPEPTRTSTALG